MTTASKYPAHAFYAEVLKILKDEKFTFMVAGGFAVNAYTGLRRPTKDIDIFCKAGDYPKILNKFTSLGYKTQVLDAGLRKSSKGSLMWISFLDRPTSWLRLPAIGSRIPKPQNSSTTRSGFPPSQI